MACIILILKSRSGVTLDLFFIDTAAAPLYVEAVGGAYYQFSDEATGFAPPRLQTVREGDALRVSFDDGPALVIGHYFSRGAGALIGLQEGGGMRRYADAPSAMPPPGRACNAPVVLMSAGDAIRQRAVAFMKNAAECGVFLHERWFSSVFAPAW